MNELTLFDFCELDGYVYLDGSQLQSNDGVTCPAVLIQRPCWQRFFAAPSPRLSVATAGSALTRGLAARIIISGLCII